MKLQSANTRLGTLNGDVTAADGMVASLTTFMKEAAYVRKVGKDENAVALKEAKAAQAAIADATVVIKEFYDKAGEGQSAAFFQRSAAPVELDDPEAPLPEYKGTPQSGDIISLLETAGTHFAQMEANTRAQEVTDQEEFEKEMRDTKEEKARRAKASETKAVEKKGLVDEIAILEKNRKTVLGEIKMAEEYQQDLEPACVTGDSTYGDRKAARKDEEDALREAQGILEDAFKATTPTPEAN